MTFDLVASNLTGMSWISWNDFIAKCRNDLIQRVAIKALNFFFVLVSAKIKGCSKGQLISKEIFAILEFFQKTKQFNHIAFRQKKRTLFFLEESSTLSDL